MTDLSVLGLCQWIEDTAFSTVIRESDWIYPIVESVHVLGLCVFVGLTAFMDLRLTGIALRRVSVSDVIAQLLPWIRIGFALMVASGVLLFSSAPVRFYLNVFFRVKVGLLLLVGLNAWRFHATASVAGLAEERARTPPLAARLAGALSFGLWAAVIAAGRLIAYDWFH